jgi:hypothetical protein
MKLNSAQNVTLAVACCIAIASFIVAGSSARGGGGPGFGPQNNPGTQGSAFGRAAASDTGTQPTQGGPGFGPGNNPGVDGSAYGRSTTSDASSGRSDGHGASFFHSNNAEEVIDTDADSGKGKGKSAEERDANHADTTGGTHALTRISSETSVPVSTLQAEKSATGLGYGDLETANLLAKASGQSFDSIVAKFKAGEGFGKIAHDMGLNLGKIVSDAHRSHPEQAKGKDEQSLIPGPGIRGNSILYTGITPIPRATENRGVKPVPSATMSPRP